MGSVRLLLVVVLVIAAAVALVLFVEPPNAPSEGSPARSLDTLRPRGVPRSREIPPESLPSIEIFPGGPGLIPPAVDSAAPSAKQVLAPVVESGNARVLAATPSHVGPPHISPPGDSD